MLLELATPLAVATVKMILTINYIILIRRKKFPEIQSTLPAVIDNNASITIKTYNLYYSEMEQSA